MKKRLLHGIAGVVGTFLSIAGAGPSHADVNLWIDDAGGQIGLVDITTGAVSMVHGTGVSLTDIGFIGSQMYGVSFTNLYSIDKATGTPTVIGSSFTAGAGMNALVGAGAGLLGASSASADIYSISPTTGVAAVTASVPLTSAGDLAFAGGSLFESAVGTSGDGQLVDVTTASIVAQFHTTTISDFDDVFGLADDGTTMYAVAGTEIYTVNLSNGLLTPVLDYSGHGLGAANGTAFLAESSAVPEPSTWGMILLGFVGLGVVGYRTSRKNPAAA
jgi:hypothetical protein